MSDLSSGQWRSAETILMQFEDSWQEKGDASIGEFLPPQGSPNRDYLLVELIKIDLEHRWNAGERLNLEHYVDKFPELGELKTIATDLIASELSVRRDHQDLATREEIAARFPNRQLELNRFDYRKTPRTSMETRSRSSDSSVSGNRRDGRKPSLSNIGRYELREELGRGAFAIVYRAWDPQLQREVAVKVPRPELVEIDELRERMLREARAAARLQHPAIVPIHEVVASDSFFIVSKLVEGETLEQRINRTEPTIREAASWVTQIARGLHCAHQSGIVHRDVKPANIMIDGHGRPMIMDFGLAQQADATAMLTQQGDIIGTPAYMSPEQARGDSHAVDRRCDVYSTGVVLYRLICGRLPFEGGSASVLARVQHETATLPRQIRRNVPRDLETICQRCLEKDPADRYESAEVLADDLDRFLEGKPIHARAVRMTERVWKWSKRHPTLAMTAWLLLATAGFLSGTALQLQRTQSQRDRAFIAEDRAKSAETEKTVLLADSYAKAGALAMQRGRFLEAISLFDKSIASGHPDPVDLQLKKVDAYFVLRKFTSCEALLQRLDTSSLDGRQRARHFMWRAELGARSTAPSIAPAEFYRKALAADLEIADQIYVEGMLTDNSLEAVQRFEESLEADPFHHRARTLLVNLLVTLGRLDAAQSQTQIGQQLFPEDPHFRLMEGFVLAVRGHNTDAVAMLNAVTLSLEDKAAWQRTYDLMNELVTLTTATKSLTSAVADQIVQSLLSERNALATVVDYGLRFPRPLTQRLTRLSELLGTVVREDNLLAMPVVEELSVQHPEGTLLIWLGQFQIARDELEAARETFREAVGTPSLLRDHRTAARMGIVATSTALAFVRGQDYETNLQYALEAVRGLDMQKEYRAAHCKLFMQVALKARDEHLCRTWLDKWAGLVDEGDRMVLWHRIELELLAGRYVEVAQICDRVLKDVPDDEHALIKRERALAAMRKAVAE